MSNPTKALLALAVALLLMTGTSIANATLINFTISGTVLNPGLGLNNGDVITATGMYDDSSLDGFGNGTILFNNGSGNTMAIDLNSLFNLTESNDQRFSVSNGASFVFSGGGNFSSFNYQSTSGTNGAPTSFGSNFLQFDANDSSVFLIGSWNTFNFTPVPVPAAVWLFSAGLIGLIGIAKRKAV